MMIYQNNTHHMTFEKKTIDLSISSTPFAFSGTPELGSRKKQVLFLGNERGEKRTRLMTEMSRKTILFEN